MSADRVTIKLDGVEWLDRKLRELPINMQKKTVRRAVRDGAKPILEAAKANALSMVRGVMGADIAKTLKVRAMKLRGGAAVRVVTAPEDEFIEAVHITKTGTRQYIPAAIEYGHAAPGDAGGVKVVPAIPFMRSAFETQTERALAAIKQRVREGLPRGKGR